MLSIQTSFSWTCKHSWMKSAKNTAVCLLGCSIGDNLTIYLFQILNPNTQMSLIMLAAMLFGLFTSITLETIILSTQIPIKKAIQVAFGMSFISMLMMEASANFTSIFLGRESIDTNLVVNITKLDCRLFKRFSI